VEQDRVAAQRIAPSPSRLLPWSSDGQSGSGLEEDESGVIVTAPRAMQGWPVRLFGLTRDYLQCSIIGMEAAY
jgi:hypothetical protein